MINLLKSFDWIEISYDSILMIIDRLTKMTHYIFVIKKIIAKQSIDVIIKKIVRFHDIFEFVVTNKFFLFTSNFYFSLCYALKIKRKLFIVFHSQIDDQTKSQNSTMKQYLRAFVNFMQNNWILFLSMTKFVYNSAKHAFITMSLFEININYNSRKCYEKKFDSKSKTSIALNYAKKLRRVDKTFRDALQMTQDTQTRFKNKHAKKRDYKIDEMIWLNVKNIRTKRNNKLKHKLFELFKIIDIKNEIKQVYELNFFASWKFISCFMCFCWRKTIQEKKKIKSNRLQYRQMTSISKTTKNISSTS